MSKVKEAQEKLKILFPDDRKLREGIAMAISTCEQLPIMNDSVYRQLLDMPEPGQETYEWESRTHLAIADVIRWSTQLELALHDARNALFYRFQVRVQERKEKSPEDIKRDENRAEAKAQVAAEKDMPPPPLTPIGPEGRDRHYNATGQKKSGKQIAALFGNLKK